MAARKETKAERFKRIAEKRTEVILDDVRKLSNLANRAVYEFTPEQVDRIFGAINDRLALARQRFEAEFQFGEGGSERFSL